MDKLSKGLAGPFHPLPQSPPTAVLLRSEGWNFKLTQIFQCFSSMFQIDIYVG